jgi:hypothetical protein
MRTRVIALATIGVWTVVAIAAAVTWWLWPAGRVGWGGAIAHAPAGADRYSWTDWSAIRSALHHPAADAIEDAAYDGDLLETTALRGHSADLAQIGLTLNDLDSELLAQSKDGDADILRLTKSVDPATWKGWTKAGGYWTAPLTISDEFLAYVAVADHGRTLIGSDNAPYLQRAIKALGQDNPVPATISGSALSAFTYSGSYACSHLTLANSGNDDQASALDLISRAGGVNPLTSFTLSRSSATEVTVRLGFENNDQARENANARSTLAVGPAPGMGGTFTDRFTLGQVTASGSIVTMPLTPVGNSALMGELSTGPVVFESC